MASARSTATVYGHMVGARVRSELQYRTSFSLFLASQFFVTLIDFLEIAVVFGRVDTLAGWSLPEVAFLYGTTGTSFALSDLFVSQVEDVNRRIRTGTFDTLLIRPVSPLVQLLADDFALRRLGKLLQAVIILAGAVAVVGVDWTAPRIAMFGVMIASGFAIFSSIFIAGACIQFFTIEAGEFLNAFTYGGNAITQYPMTVYGPWLRRFFVFLVPVGFVNYLPSLFILGRPQDDAFGLPPIARFASPLVAVVVAVAASATWSFSVRRYRSTGS